MIRLQDTMHCNRPNDMTVIEVVRAIVCHSWKFACPLAYSELDDQINTSLMSVC